MFINIVQTAILDFCDSTEITKDLTRNVINERIGNNKTTCESRTISSENKFERMKLRGEQQKRQTKLDWMLALEDLG